MNPFKFIIWTLFIMIFLNALNNYFIYFSDTFVDRDEDVIMNISFFLLNMMLTSVFKNIYFKLCDILKSNIDIKITVLPDFFIDRIIQISDMDNLTKINRKIKLK